MEFLNAFADFEGLAIQVIKEDGVTKLRILVANDKHLWERTIDIEKNVWFDFVLGWNVADGIAVKINNKRVSTAVSISSPNGLSTRAEARQLKCVITNSVPILLTKA